MEDFGNNVFGPSNVQIEDGFQFGDWRDQCTSDKMFDDCFSTRISLYDQKINKMLRGSNLSSDINCTPKHASLANEKEDLNQNFISNPKNDSSPSSGEIINFMNTFEQSKSEESEHDMTAVQEKCRNSIHLRKDIVNKSIIRALRRFYIKNFKSRINHRGKSNLKLYTVFNEQVKNKIASSASFQEYFGIVDNYDYESKIVKIIAWMVCSKSMKVRLQGYFRDIEEIQILNDVLSSYSHTKFYKIFKYKAIEALFEAFSAENRDEFLSSYNGIQKVRYQGELTNILANFKRQQCQPLSFEEWP